MSRSGKGEGNVGWLGVLTVGCTILQACGGAPEDGAPQKTPAARPNVLLVTLDTTRADRLGCYGYEKARTPTIDRIARDGVLCERALSPTPITLPTHTSLLTGQIPLEHGVRDNGIFRLDDAADTLAERLSRAGYQTAAFISARVLAREYGLAQGFDHYDDQMQFLPGSDKPYAERRASQTVNAALDWLKEPPSEPWFLWVHLFDPHRPLLPPEPFRSQFDDLYDAEIAYADQQLGRLLTRVDADRRDEQTLVVLTADHGESLGEHGEMTHGLFVYDSTQHVPLLFRHPSIPAGRRLGAQVRVTDVLPTVLEFAGLETPETAHSQSLLPMLHGEPKQSDGLTAYLETQLPRFSYGISPVAAVATAKHKFIEAPQPELYALEVDPGELDNALERKPEMATGLRSLLKTLQGGRDPNAALPNRVLSLDDRRQLEALGYTTPTETDGTYEEVDSKDYAVRTELRSRGVDAVASGKPEEGIRLLEAFLREVPGDSGAYAELGRAYLEQNDYERAISALQRCVELRPDQVLAAFDLGRLLAKTGKPEAGLAELERVIAYSPTFPDAYLAAAEICRAQGDRESERSYLETAADRTRLRKTQRAELDARLAELD